ALAVPLHIFAPYGLFAEDNWGYAWYGKKLAEYWAGTCTCPAFLLILIREGEGMFFYQVHAAVFGSLGCVPLFMSTINCVISVAAVWLSLQIAEKVLGAE